MAPFRLVPISNTTTEHMAKKLQHAIIKIAGLNKYEQFIMVKVSYLQIGLRKPKG